MNSVDIPLSQTQTSIQALALDIRDLSKRYDKNGEQFVALEDVNVQIAPGEFVCLVGASGCGKSTLLNLIAGHEKPSEGDIVRGDSTIAQMFQEPALMPWLTAQRNVELPLRIAGVGKEERAAKAKELLDLVQLSDFANSRPHELSGGMRQRVALARALAQESDVLLMDEPFGALDAITRDVLHEELERIWLDRKFSVVFVTHNAREAVRLADRVLVFAKSPGRIVEEVKVPLPRPRRIESPQVSELASHIGDHLRKEAAR